MRLILYGWYTIFNSEYMCQQNSHISYSCIVQELNNCECEWGTHKNALRSKHSFDFDDISCCCILPFTAIQLWISNFNSDLKLIRSWRECAFLVCSIRCQLNLPFFHSRFSEYCRWCVPWVVMPIMPMELTSWTKIIHEKSTQVNSTALHSNTHITVFTVALVPFHRHIRVQVTANEKRFESISLKLFVLGTRAFYRWIAHLNSTQWHIKWKANGM